MLRQALAQAACKGREQLLELTCSGAFVDLFDCSGEVSEERFQVILLVDIYISGRKSVDGPAERELVDEKQRGSKSVEQVVLDLGFEVW